MSVLQNSKEEALNTAFKGDQSQYQDNRLQELTRAVIAEVKQMPGNEVCCDCGAPGMAILTSSIFCKVYFTVVVIHSLGRVMLLTFPNRS